jgi:hypothetical protein
VGSRFIPSRPQVSVPRRTAPNRAGWGHAAYTLSQARPQFQPVLGPAIAVENRCAGHLWPESDA